MAMCIGIFYICILVGIGNKTDTNEMGNYVPKTKHWVL